MNQSVIDEDMNGPEGIKLDKEFRVQKWISDELSRFEENKEAAGVQRKIEVALQPKTNTLIESRKLVNQPTAANSLPTGSEDNLQNLR